MTAAHTEDAGTRSRDRNLGVGTDGAGRRSRFLSLRWKLVATIALVLVVIHGMLGLFHYRLQMDQFQTYLRDNLASDNSAFLAALRTSASELERLTSQLGSSLNYSAIKSGQSLDAVLPAQSLYVFDGLQVYSPSGAIVSQWSVVSDALPHPALAGRAISGVLDNATPVSMMTCPRLCYQHVYLPVITADGSEAVVGGTRSVGAALTAFREISGAEAALVIVGYGSSIHEKLELPEWDGRLVAVTNAARMREVVQDIAASGVKLPKNGQSILRRHENVTYALSLQHIASESSSGTAMRLLLLDVTETLQNIQKSVQFMIIAALAGTLLAALVLLLLLSRPMQRLNRLALALPKLAEHKFDEAARLLPDAWDKGYFRDEIEELDDVALELTEQLRSLQHAEDSSRAKTNFMASMSHEIRTPMNGVLGLAEILEHTSLDERQAELVATLKSSGKSLLRVLDDILDLSKVEAGMLEIEIVECSIEEICYSVAELMTTVAAQKDVTLIVDVDPSCPAIVDADPVRLRQVLFNLVSNAIKFTDHGNVWLRVHAETIMEDRVWLYFEVEDKGIGISEEDQERMFEPFTQAERSTTRRYGGTGLGLSICRRLIELMGGRIGVDSEPGQGSRFWFRVEFLVNPLSETPGTISLDGVKAGIALSNPEVAAVIQSYLRKAGAEAGILGTTPEVERDPGMLQANDCDVYIRDGSASGLDQRSGPRALYIVGAENIAEDVGKKGLKLTQPYRRDQLLALVARVADVEVTDAAALQSPGKVESDGNPGPGTVLVVDDNPLNRMVISRQLELIGVPTIVVETGQEALDCMEKGGCALALVDLHMPKMNGYEVARQWRSIEAASGAASGRLPVIGISASVLRDEKDRCMQAGMDAFLTKPVSIKQLQFLLSEWIDLTCLIGRNDRYPASAADSSDMQSEHVRDPVPVDSAILESLVGKGAELHATIYRSFLDSSIEPYAGLCEAYKAGKWDEAEHLAHLLTGSCRAVGAKRLAAVCQQVEAEAAKSAVSSAAMAALHEEMDRVRDYLEQQCQTNTVAVPEERQAQ